MSVALRNKANQVRDKYPVIATAFDQAAEEIDRLTGKVAQVADPIMGFQSTQRGSLFIDTLAVRNLTRRSAFSDPPDTQSFSVATYRIPLLGDWMRLNNTSAGSLTLTSVPTIAAGANGQIVELFNVGTQNIVVQDNGTLAGSTLRLGATTRTLKPRCSLELRWSQDIGGWCERLFANNL